MLAYQLVSVPQGRNTMVDIKNNLKAKLIKASFLTVVFSFF